jgi:hypothetical protein
MHLFSSFSLANADSFRVRNEIHEAVVSKYVTNTIPSEGALVSHVNRWFKS